MLMKTHAEIAHIWANGLKYNGKQGSLFYNGSTIYSYGGHFPIAKHVDENTVLFTTREYSVSTSKHKSYVMRAISHKNIIYCFSPEFTPFINVQEFIKEIQSIATNLEKARKPEIYLLQIERVKKRLQKYIDYVGFKLSKEQLAQISISSKEQYLEALQKEKERLLKKDKKEIALGKKLYPTYVSDFRNDLKNDFSLSEWRAIQKYHESIDRPTIFGVKGDEIISNLSVRVPLEVAKRYLNKFLNKEIKVGSDIIGYKVSKVTKDKLIIGCHNIYQPEIEYLKSVLL